MLAQIQILRQETGAGIMDCRNALLDSGGDIQLAIGALQEKGFKLAAQKAERETPGGIVLAAVHGAKAVLLEVNCETDFVAANGVFQDFVAAVAGIIAIETPDDVDELLKCAADPSGITVGDMLQKMIVTFRENIVLRRFEVLRGGLLFAYNHGHGRCGVIMKASSDAPEDNQEVLRSCKELAMQIAAMEPRFVSRDQVPPAFITEARSRIMSEITDDPANQLKKPEMIDRIAAGKMDKHVRTVCLMEQPYIRDTSLTVKQLLDIYAAQNGYNFVVESFHRFERADWQEQS